MTKAAAAKRSVKTPAWNARESVPLSEAIPRRQFPFHVGCHLRRGRLAQGRRERLSRLRQAQKLRLRPDLRRSHRVRLRSLNPPLLRLPCLRAK